MSEAVIVAAARTPIGKAYKGTLATTDAFHLAEVAVDGVLERAGIPTADIDDIVLAENLQGGGVIARHTAVRLGLDDVAAMSTNRFCAGGLTAVQLGAGSIMAGMDKVVVAGGTESLSTAPAGFKTDPATGEAGPWMSPSHPETPDAPAFDMSITVGHNTAVEMGLTRADLDEWAVYTHNNAIASIDNGWFDAEIIPVSVTRPDGSEVLFTTDEHPRRGTTVESLGNLSPLHPEIEGFAITAGNSSGLNDAAAAVVLTSRDYADANGVTPIARIRSWASAGVEPRRTGMGPTRAIPKALERAGLSVEDIELFEINEAFNSVPLAAIRTLGIDPSIVNVNGSGCSLGHPIACTGARMVVTMINELARRGGTIGCVSMCAGGGMGSALVLEML